MEPLSLGAGLLTGGANLLGSIFTAEQSGKNAALQFDQSQLGLAEQEQYNTAQVQEAERFNTQMSNTAYQRASQDMRAAGLNPMMMFGSGGAASSPQISGASVSQPALPTAQKQSALSNLGDILPKMVSSAGSVIGLDRMASEADSARSKALTDKNIAEGSSLELPQKRYEALKSGFRLGMKPEEIRSAAVSPEVGSAYGGWGSQIATPTKTVIDAVSNAWSKAVNAFTGTAKERPATFSSDQPRNFDERYGNW